MNGISQIGRWVWAMSLLLAPCSISIFYEQQPAVAQLSYLVASDPGDLICYMQTEDGRIINLSKLCVDKQSTYNYKAISTTDQQFLRNYQSFLRKRLGTSPLVQTALSQLQQAPQTVVERARRVCAAMSSGVAQNSPPPPQGNIDADLINTMAVEYYCPNLDD